MSLQLAAQHLASRGRGPDTQLVHMAPSEVAGLQALAKAHGGSLTVHPETGLPEAGFLSKILPMVIGAGITAATGGAAAPWMVGLGMGGLEAARTGNLMSGIQAGLGAYGGAGLGAGLLGSAATTVPEAAQMAAAAGDTTAGVGGMSGIERLSSGVQGLGTEAGREAFMQRVGGGSGLATSGLAAISPLMLSGQQQGAQYKGSGPNPYRYRYELEAPQAPLTAGSNEVRQMIGRYVPYADGGTVQSMSDRNAALTLMADGGQMFADGGMTHLGDYSDGGRLLKGPGDGVSDSIPATIADKRPARLADGEFVVPARIVSELGNGSTDAGARKLYAMMDRVQKARGKTTGKDRVAVNSRADKALPA